MLTRGQSKHGEQTAIEEFELFIRRAEQSRVAASWLACYFRWRSWVSSVTKRSERAHSIRSDRNGEIILCKKCYLLLEPSNRPLPGSGPDAQTTSFFHFWQEGTAIPGLKGATGISDAVFYIKVYKSLSLSFLHAVRSDGGLFIFRALRFQKRGRVGFVGKYLTILPNATLSAPNKKLYNLQF